MNRRHLIAQQEQVEQVLRDGGKIVYLNNQFCSYLLFNKANEFCGKIPQLLILKMDLKKDFKKEWNCFDNPKYTLLEKSRPIWKEGEPNGI